jgi:hypothetical protein
MSTLKLVYEPTNLDRAWRWILSNPDAAYKGYFRTLYANYGVASAELLRDLGERVRRVSSFCPSRRVCCGLCPC